MAAVGQRDQAIYNQITAEALQYGTTDTTLAAQLTLAAYRIQPTQDLASRLLNTEDTGVVDSVSFGPDGHVLAGGDVGGTVLLWDVADPAYPRLLGQTLTSSTAAVAPTAFSPDWHTLASGGADGVVRLWDAADPAHPRLLGQTPSTAHSARSCRITPLPSHQWHFR